MTDPIPVEMYFDNDGLDDGHKKVSLPAIPRTGDIIARESTDYVVNEVIWLEPDDDDDDDRRWTVVLLASLK